MVTLSLQAGTVFGVSDNLSQEKAHTRQVPAQLKITPECFPFGGTMSKSQLKGITTNLAHCSDPLPLCHSPPPQVPVIIHPTD